MSDSSEDIQKTLEFFIKPITYIKTHSDETEALTLISKLTKPAAVRDKNNATLLYLACRNGWYKVVVELVKKYHCDPNVKNNFGATSLHVAGYGGNLDIFRFLLQSGLNCDPNCTDNNGSVPLHYVCDIGTLEIVKFLVTEYQCNPIKKDKVGYTPLSWACYRGHSDIVAFLASAIKTNQASDKCASGESPLENIVLSSRRSHPLNPAQKVVVLGNGSAGKTTLIKSMQNKLCATSALASFADRFRQVSGVDLYTAGVIPVHIQSDKFGYFIVYDFAGQYQYYSGHIAVLQKILSSETVILLAVDVSEDKEVVVRNLNYWKTLISTLSCPGEASPEVVVVGTHADVALKQGEKPEEKLTDALKQASMSSQHSVVLNCKKLASTGLSALCNVLVQKSQSSSKQFSVNIQVHFLHALIKRELGSQVACRVSTIEHLVKKDENRVAESNISTRDLYYYHQETIITKQITLLPQDLDTLCQHLTTLSDHGHILYLKNKHNIRDGWVIINTEVLLSKVNGTIFAPEHFKRHHDMSNNTGVIPLSKISEVFHDYDLEMIKGFLKHFEFCHEIAKSEASLISKDHSKDGNGSSEKYLLFSSLVSVERPEDTCRSIEKTHHNGGWCLECVQDDQFLTSRFLHVLLLRISFTFALSHETSADDKNCPVIQRHCNMWKSGIHWQNRDGVEAIVEVVEQNTSVQVIIGCSEGAEMACTQLRPELIEMILQIKREVCEVIDTRESIIHPVELHTYPLKSSKDLHSFSVKEIAKTIAEEKQFVVRKKGAYQDREKMDSLLHFEPYSCLHHTILTQLYAVNNVDKNVARETVDAIKTQLDSHPAAPKELLRGRVVTYGDLRTALDKYSLFRGRNILDLAGVPPAPVSEHLTEGQEQIDQRKADRPLPTLTDAVHAGVNLNMVDDSTILGVDDQLEVIEALSGLESRFYNIGLALHITPGKLDAIQYNYPRRCDLALINVVSEWLRCNYGTPTWRGLVEAVDKPSGGNNPSLAECIAREHPLH